jgi:hypothetical protein
MTTYEYGEVHFRIDEETGAFYSSFTTDGLAKPDEEQAVPPTGGLTPLGVMNALGRLGWRFVREGQTSEKVRTMLLERAS